MSAKAGEQDYVSFQQTRGTDVGKFFRFDQLIEIAPFRLITQNGNESGRVGRDH